MQRYIVLIVILVAISIAIGDSYANFLMDTFNNQTIAVTVEFGTYIISGVLLTALLEVTKNKVDTKKKKR